MPMKILLVEDDPSAAAFISKKLHDESYTVDQVLDGEAGLKLASTGSYEVILLKLMLPTINGIEICEKMRSQGIQTPILMMAAGKNVRDKIRGLDSGADDFLTKPFSLDELAARIRAVLRRYHTEPMELSYRGLRIETVSHKVFFGEQEILLRPKEYGVFLLLIKNQGQVISRTQIFEQVWSRTDNPSTNVIDVYIKILRDKLALFFDEEIIKTVRGRGYMVERERT
jgi:DNA-binding response OmpR family regulator